VFSRVVVLGIFVAVFHITRGIRCSSAYLIIDFFYWTNCWYYFIQSPTTRQNFSDVIRVALTKLRRETCLPTKQNITNCYFKRRFTSGHV